MAKRTQAQRQNKTRTLRLVRRDVVEVAIVIVLLGLFVAAVHKLQAPATLPIRNVHFISRLQYLSQEELKHAVSSSLSRKMSVFDRRASSESPFTSGSYAFMRLVALV